MLSQAGCVLLRRLALGDPMLMKELVDLGSSPSGRDEAHGSLFRLSVAIAMDAGEGPVIHEVAAALRHGCTPDEIVRVLPAIAPLVGSLRLMAAAAPIAVALGYDLDAAIFD